MQRLKVSTCSSFRKRGEPRLFEVAGHAKEGVLSLLYSDDLSYQSLGEITPPPCVYIFEIFPYLNILVKPTISDRIFFIDENCKETQELRAHMALVTRQEELRAKSSYGMSSNKILRFNRLI